MPYHPMVSVIVCSLNGADRLPECLGALEKTTYPQYEVIVVDNGSTDGTSEVAKRHRGVKVVRAESNLGFAGGNNLGMTKARGDIYLLLNDDCVVEPGWLEPIGEAAMTLPDWGILGCLLLYPDGETIQHAGGLIERNGLTKHFGYGKKIGNVPTDPAKVPYVTGAAFAIQRALVGLLGPMDEGYWPIYFEETDLCFRAGEIGYASYLVPGSRVIHHESQTTEVYSTGFLKKYHRNRWRFIIKNFARRDLMRAVKAEVKWLKGHRPSDHAGPMLHAMLATLINLPKLLVERLRNRRRLWWLRHRLQTQRRDVLIPVPSPLGDES